MSLRPTPTTVVSSFMDQLVGMGWRLGPDNLHQPSVTGCEALLELLIKSDLRTAIRQINGRDGKLAVEGLIDREQGGSRTVHDSNWELAENNTAMFMEDVA